MIIVGAQAISEEQLLDPPYLITSQLKSEWLEFNSYQGRGCVL